MTVRIGSVPTPATGELRAVSVSPEADGATVEGCVAATAASVAAQRMAASTAAAVLTARRDGDQA
ncbi:hypothetical protein [Demequina mangrovi]|uniref:Uncharacterized protein n=1 Tax=Demequina mangrovi TaxID=1043493 RepID=A0A1H6ZT11_9MICO|nr:hypothetical protein [Demequina mangrovi]SEJ56491.1 hypothetical protein SAMN05421637_2211 [Demequina mangrovi]